MATISYTEMFGGFLCLFFVYYWIRDRNSPFIHYPIIGTLPGALRNLPHLHEYVFKRLKQSGGTFEFRGPRFCNMDFLVTCDPMNTQYIMSRNSSNYNKGPDFSSIFEPVGDGILTADSDSWKLQRKMIHSYLKDGKFKLFLERTLQEKVANSLFPVLNVACSRKTEVNLGDVFKRLGFDIVCLLFLGIDPACLSMELPQKPYDKAINDMLAAVIHRHVVPDKYWKLMRWLQIGPEKKLTQGLKIFDDFIYQCIESKREKYLVNKTNSEENRRKETNFDFLTSYLTESIVAEYDCKVVRDVLTSLVLAGRDGPGVTLSWFFWLLATNQSAEAKILQEIKHRLQQKRIYSAEELEKLVYLHAALCETLRLYPSLPINHKCSVLQDTLPSGHRVKPNTKIFISFHAMGTMEEIWGKDCYEFKPERWISDAGEFVRVPSYKFPAFSVGQRTCLGKDMSFVQMKIIAAAIISNYHLQVVDDHSVVASTNVLLHMKNGLKVRVTKRSIEVAVNTMTTLIA